LLFLFLNKSIRWQEDWLKLVVPLVILRVLFNYVSEAIVLYYFVPVTINQEAAKLQNLLTRIAADVCQPTFATVDQMTRDSIRINHMKNDIDNRHDFVDADANLCVQEDLMLRP